LNIFKTRYNTQSRPQIKWRYRRSQPKFIAFTVLLPIVVNKQTNKNATLRWSAMI